MLTLKWRRVENGLWAAGPYVLRYGANRGTWRIEKNERRLTERETLKAAKQVCVDNYAAEQRSAASCTDDHPCTPCEMAGAARGTPCVSGAKP